MAIREKTVEFAFPMADALVADATVTNLAQITVYIPEASPTFTSVFAEVGFQDVITATGGTITEHRCALRLGAAGYTTITETDDITNSGENMAGVVGPFDFTSHFVTNWTGTSMTCDAQVYFDQNTGTTLGMANVTVFLRVTYTYDDTAATQIKTVRIPLESLTAALAVTNVGAGGDIGTNQIPQLTSGGILPEAGVVIRDYFIIVEGNEAGGAATADFFMRRQFDADTFNIVSAMTQERALASDRFCRWVFREAAPPDTDTAHTLKLWNSTGAYLPHCVVTLHVTYEFTLSGTTRTLNSVLLPIEIASPLGSSTAADASRFQRQISVQELGTITIRQSGFRLNYNTATNPGTFSMRAGGQAFRTYTSGGVVMCGMFSVQQRIDDGSAQGAGITLARGMNTITIDAYCPSTSVELTNISGYILLNYECDVPAGGVGQAAHTVMKVMLPWDAALTDRNRIINFAFAIPEANYWVTAAGFCFTQWMTSASSAITFDVQLLPGEGKEAGYSDIYADAYVSDSERACSMIWMRGRDTFKRFPADADPNRLDIETARDYRLFTSTTCGNGIIAVMTYHSFTWTAAGAISGHDPLLPTQVNLVKSSGGEIMQTLFLSAGTTAFSFTVNDNTEFYQASAYQDATHLGLSAPGLGV